MKQCICGIDTKKTVSRADVIIGTIVIIAVMGFAYGGSGFVALAVVIALIGVLLASVYSSFRSGAHSAKCSLRAALIKVLGFGGFVSF